MICKILFYCENIETNQNVDKISDVRGKEPLGLGKKLRKSLL